MIHKQDTRTEVEADATTKRRLERMFQPLALRLLNQMLLDARLVFIATGQMPALISYQNEWQAALLAQYRRVGQRFLPKTPRKQEDEDELSAASAFAAFLLFMRRRAPEQAARIVQTSERQTGQAFIDAQQQLVADDPLARPSRATIAALATTILKKRNRQRSSIIANVETQAPAEEAKLLDARAKAGQPVLPFQQVTQPPKAVKKTWITVGDERVRIAHANADFQERREQDPFNVGGELLKYPGDTSLGATPGNIINCRCGAKYEAANG